MPFLIAVIVVGFMHSLEKYLLSIYWPPATVLNVEPSYEPKLTPAYFVMRKKTINKGMDV